MKTINIPDTKTLSHDEKADILWDVLSTLYDEVEMERTDVGYSITIELEDEEEDLETENKVLQYYTSW